MFDQTAPEVLAEVRQLAWQGFQRRDEPLELSPADAALPDFRRKGVPLCQEDSNHRISGGCKVFTLQDNSHEAIIDPETFEMVQRELARRTKGKNRHSGVHLLSGRIKCGDCGGWYGSKVWHSPEKCKRTVWQCNQKYKNEVRCTTPYLDEASVKERFTVAVNQLLAGRDAAIAAYEQGMAMTLDTSELESQQQELLSEMEVLNGMIQQMIRQNATVVQDQTEYNQRFDALSQKFKEAEAKKDAVAQP